MINSCCKCNLRWFEGVVCRKMNCQKEYTTLIWAVIRSHNCGLPMKHVISNWTCRTLCWRVTGQITKFLINPFQRHSLCFSPGSSLSRCVPQRPGQKLLIVPAARKDRLFFSHRLCQTQAPFAKTEQISHSPGASEKPCRRQDAREPSRSGQGGVAKPPTTSARGGSPGERARVTGRGRGEATGSTSRPLERKSPGWERKRRRRKGWVRGRGRSRAEEEPGPSRR